MTVWAAGSQSFWGAFKRSYGSWGIMALPYGEAGAFIPQPLPHWLSLPLPLANTTLLGCACEEGLKLHRQRRGRGAVPHCTNHPGQKVGLLLVTLVPPHVCLKFHMVQCLHALHVEDHRYTSVMCTPFQGPSELAVLLLAPPRFSHKLSPFSGRDICACSSSLLIVSFSFFPVLQWPNSSCQSFFLPGASPLSILSEAASPSCFRVSVPPPGNFLCRAH